MKPSAHCSAVIVKTSVGLFDVIAVETYEGLKEIMSISFYS